MNVRSVVFNICLTPLVFCNLLKASGHTDRTAFHIGKTLLDLYFDIKPELQEAAFKKLRQNMEDLSNQLSDVYKTENGEAYVSLNRMKLELQLDKIFECMISIDRRYDASMKYFQGDHYEQSTLENFVDSIISHHTDSITSLIERIYNYFVPKQVLYGDNNILARIREYLEESQKQGTLCEIQQSPQQIIYEYYKAVINTEIKSQIMTTFAYSYRKISFKENYTQEVLNEGKKYADRIKNLSRAFWEIMQSTSSQIWQCDPKVHALDATYLEITKFIQGYILNEQNLSNDGLCYKSCKDYKIVKNRKCRGHSWCQYQRPCRRVLNCTTIDSRKSHVYFKPGYGDRRYEYVHLQDRNQYFGANTNEASCKRQTLDVFVRRLFWDCSYCFCLCDEQGFRSVRHINLKASLADFKENKVVTGLRFVKRNNIIHLQVQQGTLLPFGRIDNNTVEWVPVNNYRITDRYIKEGQDYHSLSLEERAFDLDDISTAPEHVVTGVRFKRDSGHIKLEILQTPFNFETGQLEVSTFKSSFRSHAINRDEVDLSNSDVPTKAKFSKPNLNNGEFLRFTPSDRVKDAAQTTVPFFDAQPVVSWEPLPLGGVGVFLKSQSGFGGFIAPKLTTYDLSSRLLAAVEEHIE